VSDDTPYEPSAEEHNLLVAAIQTKIKNAGCELCGTNTWTINTAATVTGLLDLRTPSRPSVLTNAVGPQLVTMTCANCGNTKFLNARTLREGVVDHWFQPE
jgi:proline racemase